MVALSLAVAACLAPRSATGAVDLSRNQKSTQALQEQEECTANLREIFAAVRAYRSEHNDLPNWLSDLVPKHLTNTDVLVCPTSKRTGQFPQFGFFDPKMRVSYLFEFCTARVPPNLWGGSRMTMREWKTKQMGLIGSEIPMVRCPMHDPVLNLAYDGTIYGSELTWERKYAGKISMDALAPYAGELVKMWLGPHYVGEVKPAEWPYQKAYNLYLDGKLNEAYAAFQKVVETTPDTSPVVFHAEGWMGRIQIRLGNLDQAMEHYQRAQEKLKKIQKPDEVWHQIDELVNLENIFMVLIEQGKMGLAQRYLDDTEKVHERIKALSRGKGILGTEYCSQPYHVVRCYSVNRAELLSHAGHFEEAEKRLKEIAEEAEDKFCTLTYGNAIELLAGQKAYQGRLEEAIVLAGEISEMRYRCAPEYRRPLRKIQYASYLGQREGITQQVWDLVEESLARLKKSPAYAELLSGQTIKASLLMKEGLTREAQRLLNEVIEGAKQKNHRMHLAEALEVRGRLYLNAGDALASGADLKEALLIYRTLARKDKEPNLYELYAQLNARLGHYEQSLQLWEQAFEVCQNLKVPARALDMLLGIVDLQLRMGHEQELAKSWERIDQFLKAHTNLPDALLFRLHLARLDYLKSKEDRATLEASYEKARTFAGGSKLTFYQSRPLLAYDLDKKLDLPPRKKAPPAVVQKQKTTVDLQPILVNTRVGLDEIARARFVLSNPTTTLTQGTLSLDAPNLGVEWTTNEHGLLVKLAASVNAANSGLELAVQPGLQVPVLLESRPLEPDVSHSVKLVWREGSVAGQANWEFGFGKDSRKLVVANASLAEDNPFYAIDFYHEVYFRGEAPVLKNLRIETSEACRVEVVEQTSHSLLAIDANGDGDFADAGDVVYVDADQNLYPDLSLSNETDVAILELAVFPHFKQDRSEREIRITLSWDEGGAWAPQVVNKLVLK